MLIAAVACDVSEIVGDGWSKDASGYKYPEPAAKFDEAIPEVVPEVIEEVIVEDIPEPEPIEEVYVEAEPVGVRLSTRRQNLKTFLC